MAGFQTHITVSTVTGIAYGVWGWQCGAPLETCILAGGLCSVSGMLPDLDSDSGRPVQEMSCFAAAVVPMLMLERFENFGWSHEMMVLAAAGIYAADPLRRGRDLQALHGPPRHVAQHSGLPGLRPAGVPDRRRPGPRHPRCSRPARSRWASSRTC